MDPIVRRVAAESSISYAHKNSAHFPWKQDRGFILILRQPCFTVLVPATVFEGVWKERNGLSKCIRNSLNCHQQIKPKRCFTSISVFSGSWGKHNP